MANALAINGVDNFKHQQNTIRIGAGPDNYNAKYQLTVKGDWNALAASTGLTFQRFVNNDDTTEQTFEVKNEAAMWTAVGGILNSGNAAYEFLLDHGWPENQADEQDETETWNHFFGFAISHAFDEKYTNGGLVKNDELQGELNKWNDAVSSHMLSPLTIAMSSGFSDLSDGAAKRKLGEMADASANYWAALMQKMLEDRGSHPNNTLSTAPQAFQGDISEGPQSPKFIQGDKLYIPLEITSGSRNVDTYIVLEQKDA